MTDKTPIEKAAEDIRNHSLWSAYHADEDIEVMADIFRRRLEKEVELKPDPNGWAESSQAFGDGWNDCRRAIGLTDEEETT